MQDVIAHLIGVDQFWNLSVASGVGGNPTRYLEGFDPTATPAAMVAGLRGTPPAQTLDAFVAASDAFCTTIERLEGDEWKAMAEAPVGHVAVSALGHHALWDCWVHERDILLPLGRAQDHHDDEIRASLSYVAALGPAFGLVDGTAVPQAIAIEATGPDTTIILTVTDHVGVDTDRGAGGATRIRGDAVALIEALSLRAPWPADIDPASVDALGGLAAAFATDPTI